MKRRNFLKTLALGIPVAVVSNKLVGMVTEEQLEPGTRIKIDYGDSDKAINLNCYYCDDKWNYV